MGDYFTPFWKSEREERNLTRYKRAQPGEWKAVRLCRGKCCSLRRNPFHSVRYKVLRVYKPLLRTSPGASGHSRGNSLVGCKLPIHSTATKFSWGGNVTGGANTVSKIVAHTVKQSPVFCGHDLILHPVKLHAELLLTGARR